ncbi:MAG TPA: 2-phospho-L-lactate transferase [Anaerolineaceae bacterium]|nr:2-phospho-L-lactate transferase [Anaerolineaceae bacterium]
MKVVALAGGVGGAKLADGLYRVVPAEDLTVIVNTGDDFDHLGLRICPDLDTVCYTLAEMANPQTGWGQTGETWQALESIRRLNGPDWFALGDRDLGVHLERTRRLKDGASLSQVTAQFCQSWGIRAQVLPMSDDPIATIVQTADDGELGFQEYFVHRRCEPRVVGFRFEGIEAAQPAPSIEAALRAADAVIICPSNPWVSIGPILSVPGIQPLLAGKTVVAVSPIIGGKAIKGPAAKMYQELGFEPSALTVFQHYGRLLRGYVFDEIDRDISGIVEVSSIIPLVTATIMVSLDDRRQLAKQIFDFCTEISRRHTDP